MNDVLPCKIIYDLQLFICYDNILKRESFLVPQKKKKKKRIFLLIISFDALDAYVNLETLRLTISIETQIFLKKIKKKKKPKQN